MAETPYCTVCTHADAPLDSPAVVCEDCRHLIGEVCDEHARAQVTESQKSLLLWLSKEEYSQYGECHGADLDALIALGYAEVHDDLAKQSGFIARGSSLMYRAVSLTEAGRQACRTS